jgi:uncharacterized membrane protein YgcG
MKKIKIIGAIVLVLFAQNTIAQTARLSLPTASTQDIPSLHPPYRVILSPYDSRTGRMELAVTIYPEKFNIPIGTRMRESNAYVYQNISPAIIRDVKNSLYSIVHSYEALGNSGIIYPYALEIVPQTILLYKRIILQEIARSNIPFSLQVILNSDVTAEIGYALRETNEIYGNALTGGGSGTGGSGTGGPDGDGGRGGGGGGGGSCGRPCDPVDFMSGGGSTAVVYP